MPRQPRKNQKEETFYHIMVQGINKEYIFRDEKLINKYLKILLENKNEFKVEIIAYCIMNNHAHLLLYGENIEKISKMMQKINTIYARYYNKNQDRVGYVFRDRYLSQPIRNNNQFINCVKYIHNNPVKAKMVNNPKEYKFSNYIEFYSKGHLKKVKEISGIDFEHIGNIEPYIEGDFIDEEVDIKERVLACIRKFCNENKVKMSEIFEDRVVLKKLVKYLKIKYNIKYIEIRKIMEIPKGIMDRLKV